MSGSDPAAGAPAARSSQEEPHGKALSQQERQFRLLVNGVTDYALYMIAADGTVATWNVGAERIKGYAAAEIVGRHFSCFYTDADRAAGVPARALAAARATGRYEAEGWRVRKGGAFFWASVVIDAIHDEDGAFVGFAKITRDISERRAAQQVLERVQQQLAHSQKMDAIGQLTGGVAHDFNNLLMALGGHVQTLKRLVKDEPRGVRAVEAIELATRRGAVLTRQLLTFARRQRVNPTAVAIGDLIEALHDVLSSGLGRSVALHVRIPPETWLVRADPGELETALVNLAINARDAMPEGGSLSVSAENIVVDPEHPLRRAPETAGMAGDHVALTVADTGSGIPPDILARIFEPFFTTKPLGKGTGLGLAQVHGFVHQAGGTVRVESTVGQGTRITLYLPRAPDGLAVPEIAIPQATLSGVGTILLVEDNPEVASGTTALLEQLGYKVRAVASADDALLVLDIATGIDLVLSDVVMPGRIDGLALARILRKRRPELPIVLMTGYSEAMQSAGDQFPMLNKPFQLDELSRAVARHFDGNRPPRGVQ